MNTVWSTYIQSISTIYDSRALRFSDMFKKKYTEIFKIDGKEKILEVGCGPGALAQSLSRWYPDSQIFGIDRDSNFIGFAKTVTPDISFTEGDATALPYEDSSFDVTVSNTVAEHIEPSKFYGEQYRVLKNGGVCLVLSARKGIRCTAPCLQMTSEEIEFWESLYQSEDELQKYGVGKFAMSEAELPASMEKYGFT